MSDKLSPKDFDSITEWMKQYIIGGIKGTLSNPVIKVKSNDYNQLIYTVNNPNEVDAYFNDELISANGQSELTHIWNESTFTITGKLTAKNWNDSEVVSLKVERAPKLYNITVSATTNGTITCNKTQASAGDVITITCTASSGYALGTLTVNGTSIFVSGTTTYTYTMKEEDVVISGTFKQDRLSLSESDITYSLKLGYMNLVYIKNNNKIQVTATVELYGLFGYITTVTTTINANNSGAIDAYTASGGGVSKVIVVLSATGYTSSYSVSKSIS